MHASCEDRYNIYQGSISWFAYMPMLIFTSAGVGIHLLIFTLLLIFTSAGVEMYLPGLLPMKCGGAFGIGDIYDSPR